MSSHAKLDELITACRERTERFHIPDEVKEDAKKHFNLNTKEEILDFIANEGLKQTQYRNTKIWGNNPNPRTEISVYAYNFSSGLKDGYIAFFFNPAVNTWWIKSFKRNADLDPVLADNPELVKLKKELKSKERGK